MRAEPAAAALRVAVTGSSGFVGSHLAAYLETRGMLVKRLARKAPPGAAAWELGEKPDLTEIDVLVHCAHSFGDAASNVEGTRRLYEAAVRDRVSFVLFISSMAAFDGCVSEYGQVKLLLERETSQLGGASLRPGTVWSENPGGLMGALERTVRALPIVPLIGAGRQGLYLVHVEDLCQTVARAIQQPGLLQSEVLTVAFPRVLSLAQILRIVARRLGKRRLFLPVPVQLFRGTLTVAEWLAVPVGFGNDSLRSLLHPNPGPDFRRPSFLPEPRREFR